MAATANTAETAVGRDARMRRVAILLSSLPSPLAAKLLGSIDPASKQGLRRAMTTLSDVDPMERHRVIEAFRVSIARESSDQFSAVSEGGDTFESSSSMSSSSMSPGSVSSGSRSTTGASTDRYAAGASTSPVLKNGYAGNSATEDPSEASSPLAFLNRVEDEALSDLLKDEHPQAVALVLASVPPEKAGRVLPLLPDQLRSQALSRIGRLGEIPEEAANDLANHFKSRIGQVPLSKSTATGKRKLDAILASMPSTDSPRESADPNQPGSDPVSSGLDTYTPSRQNPVGRSDAEVSAIDLSHRLQVVSEDSTGQRPPAVAKVPSPSTASASVSLGSTDAIHARLLALTPTQLCQSLARVETRDAMLCLCGLPNPVAEAALALLPKDQAGTVREQINGLSALNLREIDRAKESVASASMMFQSNSSKVPASRAVAA